MALESKNPHDGLFRDVFGDPQHAISYLQNTLPQKITARLDTTEAEQCSEHYVNKKFRGFETDVLYKIKLADRPAFAYFLIEHQSSVDHMMPLRLLRYMTLIWDKWYIDNDKPKKLPPIIPIVLYHGSGGWTAAREFISIIDAPDDLLNYIRPFIPAFTYILDDLTLRDDRELEELRATALVRLTMLLFKHIRDRDLAKQLPKWAGIFRDVVLADSKEALVRILVYAFQCNEGVTPEGLEEWLNEAIEDPEGEVLMTAAERFREEGREEGWQKGHEVGLNKGLKAGHKAGHEAGHKAGRRSLLLRQLTLRFGDLSSEVVDRVQCATPEQMEVWAERVLTAKSAMEVLNN